MICIESVKSVFALLSGIDDCEKYSSVITLAVHEVEDMLIDEDCADIRLDFLCAALANFRVQQLLAAHDRSEFTFAGKTASVSSAKNVSPLHFAEKLLGDYLAMCKNLVKPQPFVFFSCGGKGDCSRA